MAKKATQQDVETAIKRIQWVYDLGDEILKQCGNRSPPGAIAKLAEQRGVSRDKAQKYRAMAMRRTGFTQTDLNRWFGQFRKADYALTVSHFVKLISVPDKDARNRFVEQAIRNRWSSHRLQYEIVATLGRRQIGGRRPMVITGEGFEKHLAQNLWSWNHWLETHEDAIALLGPELKKEMNSLKRSIARLCALQERPSTDRGAKRSLPARRAGKR